MCSAFFGSPFTAGRASRAELGRGFVEPLKQELHMQKLKRIAGGGLTAFLIGAVAVGCSDLASPNTSTGDSALGSFDTQWSHKRHVVAVTVTLDSSALAVGQTTKAHAVATSNSGAVISGQSVTWSSSATDVATVSDSGIVAAVAPGSASIRATISGTSGVANVTVAATGAATQVAITTQPSATATSGTAFPQQPVVQLTDSNGAAARQSGVAVTAAIATGGGTLGGTTTATTNANGMAAFTNLSITGSAGPRTLVFNAAGLSGATSNGVNVTAAQSGDSTLASEPMFDASTQTLLMSDDMSYSALSDAVAAGWRCTDGSTTQDTSTNPAGACQFTTGYTGASDDRAMRLVYDGKANADGQEGHAWSHTLSDRQAALPGHTLYISYYFRVNPGGGFTLDDAGGGPHIVKVKWLELWTNTDRAQFSTAYQTCYNNVPQVSNTGGGTIWNFFANAGNNTTCQAGQVRPPFMYQGQGQWHRLTQKYVSRSSSTATDGVAQLWYDGTLIVSVKASDCGVTVPGAVNDAAVGYPSQPTTAENHYPAQWCQTKDLTGFFVNQPVIKMTLGGTSTSILWPFSIDYDHMMIWRD